MVWFETGGGGGGGGGYPLSVKKKSIKNSPKNRAFFAKSAVFGNGPSVKGGGDTPFSVKKFPLTYYGIMWKKFPNRDGGTGIECTLRGPRGPKKLVHPHFGDQNFGLPPFDSIGG